VIAAGRGAALRCFASPPRGAPGQARHGFIHVDHAVHVGALDVPRHGEAIGGEPGGGSC
jgi:hypothetical protein